MRVLSVLKLLAVLCLVAGSVGLLWQNKHAADIWGVNYFYYELGLVPVPDWTIHTLQGWFAPSAQIIWRVF